MTVKNVCFKLISQFFYPFIFAGITAFFLFTNFGQKYSIPINDGFTFDSKKNPIWIAHMTDIYLREDSQQLISRINSSFNFIHNFIKPAFLLITGDIVENYKKDKTPRVSGQIESQFKLYRNLLESSGVLPYTFETLGNHDVWSISNKSETNVEKYFAIGQLDVSYSKTRNGVRMVSLNPFLFPSGVGSLGTVPKLHSDFLANLEEVLNLTSSSNFTSHDIESNGDDLITIVASHFTTSTIYPQEKTPKSMLELSQLLDLKNVSVFLNGHTHPTERQVWHHQGNHIVEITGFSSNQYEGFSLLTVDNGQINYQKVIPNQKFAVVTYPSPSAFSSSILPSYDGTVRVLSFVKNVNLKATLDEKYSCDLQLIRDISENSYLYQCKLNGIEKVDLTGSHSLNVKGTTSTQNDEITDFDETVKFNVNSELVVKEKQNIKLFNCRGIFVGVGLGITYHILLFLGIIFPFTVDCFGEYYENILYCLLLGPFVSGFRFKKLEIWAKAVLAISIIWPMFLPTGFFYTGGERAVLSSWGYSVKGDFAWDTYFLIVFIDFLFFTAIAIEEAFFVVATRWRRSYIADIIMAVLLYLVSLGPWFYFGFGISSGWFWLASFPFFVFPLISIVAVSIHRPLRKARKLRDAEIERMRQLNDELLNEEKGELEGEEEPTPIP